VVDDEPMIRKLLQLQLQQLGFRVLVAADGREALGLYQTRRSAIALVLLDVRMPDLDGPQTLAALRQYDPAVCACFLTGHAGEYTEEYLLERGAARVFAKPLRSAELGSGLREVIAQKECCGV
jgi:CheY-like chemotaxis protein